MKNVYRGGIALGISLIITAIGNNAGLQRVSDADYARFAEDLLHRAHDAGFTLDPNFFRWQMADFSGAWGLCIVTEYGLAVASAALQSRESPALECLGKFLLAARIPLSAAITFGWLVGMEYGVIGHLLAESTVFSPEDLVAYAAGTALYLATPFLVGGIHAARVGLQNIAEHIGDGIALIRESLAECWQQRVDASNDPVSNDRDFR